MQVKLRLLGSKVLMVVGITVFLVQPVIKNKKLIQDKITSFLTP